MQYIIFTNAGPVFKRDGLRNAKRLAERGAVLRRNYSTEWVSPKKHYHVLLVKNSKGRVVHHIDVMPASAFKPVSQIRKGR